MGKHCGRDGLAQNLVYTHLSTHDVKEIKGHLTKPAQKEATFTNDSGNYRHTIKLLQEKVTVDGQPVDMLDLQMFEEKLSKEEDDD